MNPYMFQIGSFGLRWYSFLILVSIILGIILVEKEGKRFNISKDVLFNMCFWAIIFGIIGARIYYVLFNFSLYKSDPLSIIKIWEGGLAIHGGIIAGVLTILFYSKKYEINLLRITDICIPALLLAQAIGRWGNFFNGEAHGPATTLELLQKLHIPKFIINGMKISGIYYQPTFLYESLFCLLGFLIILIIRRRKYIKVGVITGFYLIYYGIVRFIIESMRTDSLMLGSIKAAQIVSVIMGLIGIIMILAISRKGKFESLYNTTYNDK